MISTPILRDLRRIVAGQSARFVGNPRNISTRFHAVRFQRIVEDGGVGVEDPPAMVGDGQSGESGGTTGVVETVVGVVGGPTGVLEGVEAQPARGD